MKLKTLAITVSLTAGLATTIPALAQKDDSGLGHDYRTFHADGKIDYGNIGDSYTADLSIYVAANQFMVMEELMGDFQKKSRYQDDLPGNDPAGANPERANPETGRNLWPEDCAKS